MFDNILKFKTHINLQFVCVMGVFKADYWREDIAKLFPVLS
jgi:hypothetical protein